MHYLQARSRESKIVDVGPPLRVRKETLAYGGVITIAHRFA